MTDLYPLLFDPVLKDYIWGGRNLEILGRNLPPEGIIAESWEIAGHRDGNTHIANGYLSGLSLTDIHALLGLNLIGSNNEWAQRRNKFPLLVKLLDANRPLSVQVHPDDDYALKVESNELGKTEMWVVLQADLDAEIILGVKAGTTPEKFRKAIEDGRLEPYLHHLPVKAGDHICVPAGSLHAIMGGLIIAEIQQNSNTTYRVYDWNRLGADGKPRPLHIDKALDVINFDQVEPALQPPKPIANQNGIERHELCRNQYFVTERFNIETGSTFEGLCDGRTMEIWGILNGEALVNNVLISAVQFILLPAALGPYTITTQSAATLLRTYAPDA